MIVKFDFASPAQQIVFGADSIDRLGELVERLQCRRLLLCTSWSQQRSGRVAQIQAALGPRLVATYGNVQPHVPDYQVSQVLALAEENGIDAVIGLGGGSPIGMAKAASHGSAEKRAGKSGQPTIPADWSPVPVIAIPTTFAGSEMTPVFGITYHAEGGSHKLTVTDPQVTPRLVIYDPRLFLDLPPEMTASTGINALAHCVEALYSITRNPLSTAAALEGAQHIAHALPRCYADGKDLEVRTEMLTGAYLAGVSLSNVAMGLHHGLCHILGGTAGIPHGVANAIILPHAMRYNADACADELAPLVDAFGIAGGMDNIGAVQRAADWIYELIGQMNLPQHLRLVGIKESELVRLAELAAQSRTVQNNPKRVGVEEIAGILQAAW